MEPDRQPVSMKKEDTPNKVAGTDISTNGEGGKTQPTTGRTLKPEDDPAAFLKQNGDFLIKISANGGEGVTKVYLRKFNDLSFEELMKQVEKYAAETIDGKKQLSYVDKDGDKTLLVTTESFLFALEERAKDGFVKIDVSQIVSKQPPLSIAIPVAVSSPTIANQTTTNRKRAASGTTKKAPAKRSKSSSSISSTAAPMPSGAIGPYKAGSVHSKIVYSMLELRALGIHSPPKIQVALLSGYTNQESPGFRKALSGVSKEGYIDFLPSKCLTLTDKAIQSCVSPPNPPTNNAAVHGRMCGILGKGKNGATKIQQIFMMLADGKQHTKKAVGTANGYTNIQSPGFRKALSQLGGYGLLEYPTKGLNGTVQLTDICFPFGRPGTEGSNSSSSGDNNPAPAMIPAAPANTGPAPVTPTPALSTPPRASGRARKPTQKAVEGQESEEAMAAMATTTPAVAAVAVTPDSAKSTRTVEPPKKKGRKAAVPDAVGSNGTSTMQMCQVAAGSVEHKILCALAELRALSVHPVPLMTVVLLAGYTNSSTKAFSRAMSTVKNLGYCRVRKQMVEMEESGLCAIPKVRPPATNEEVHSRLCAVLGQKKGSSSGKTAEMFMLLTDGAKTRHDLMKALGYSNLSSKGFSVALSELKSYGLISTAGSGGKGCVELTDTCFPHGRP